MDRAMLNKATSADDVPTPGYMYGEIARSTFGDINAPQQLADYLLKKLERDSPQVKVKVLRIIKHVCEQGKPDFRRAVQKKSNVVKSCLQYRGTPDPLKGDAPNKAVRDEADAAVKAVFSSDTQTNAYGVQANEGPKMQGFGSESGPGDFGGSSMGGGKATSFSSMGNSGGMVGFGNPAFDNAPPRQAEDTKLSQAMGAAGSMFSKIAGKVQGSIPGAGSPHIQTDPGPSSYRAPSMNGPNNLSESRWGSQSDNSRSGHTAMMSSGAQKDAGEYEARVVAELCAPGGPRAAPPPQALEDFCRKCESLDATAVAAQLRTKLEDPSWQTRLKALYAVEALSNKGLDGIVGHISQFSSELLFECLEMPQCKAKASKVLQLLGFTDGSDEKPAAARRETEAPSAGGVAAAPAAPAATMDLLDLAEGPPSGMAAPPAADSLLGGLSQADGPPSGMAAPPAAPSLLGGLSQAPSGGGVAAAPAAPTATMDFLDLGPPSGTAAPPAADSLLGRLSQAGGPPSGMAAPPAAASLFGGLSQAGGPPSGMAAPPAAASLFGGLSQAGGPPSGMAAPAAAPLFGGLSQAGGPLSGMAAPPAAAPLFGGLSQAGGPPYGMAAPQAAATLFGGLSQAGGPPYGMASPPAAAPLFGGLSQAGGPPSGMVAPPAAAPLFGGLSQAGGPLSGMAAPAAAASLFGGLSQAGGPPSGMAAPLAAASPFGGLIQVDGTPSGMGAPPAADSSLGGLKALELLGFTDESDEKPAAARRETAASFENT